MSTSICTWGTGNPPPISTAKRYSTRLSLIWNAEVNPQHSRGDRQEYTLDRLSVHNGRHPHLGVFVFSNTLRAHEENPHGSDRRAWNGIELGTVLLRSSCSSSAFNGWRNCPVHSSNSSLGARSIMLHVPGKANKQPCGWVSPVSIASNY